MTDFEQDYHVQLKPSENQKEDFPKKSVIIPIINSPIFPGMIAPIILTEEKFSQELDKKIFRSGYVALNLVKANELAGSPEEDVEDDELTEIEEGDIYKVGVICKVLKKLKLPDGSVNLLVHGMKRYRASNIKNKDSILTGEIEVFDDILETDEELDAYTRSIINQVKKLSEINLILMRK